MGLSIFWHYIFISFIHSSALVNSASNPYPPPSHVKIWPKGNGVISVSWLPPSINHQNEIAGYVVEARQLHNPTLHNIQKTESYHTNISEFNNIVPGVKYELRVQVLYSGHHSAWSGPSLYFTLHGNGTMQKHCQCDFVGSLNSTAATCVSGKPCVCKKQYTGSDCVSCIDGYFRRWSLEKDECRECKMCDKSVSDGTCYWDSRTDSVHCTSCKKHFSGKRCLLCALGYYAAHPVNHPPPNCQPCGCMNGAPQVCEPDTGKCSLCPEGTYGLKCQVKCNPKNTTCIAHAENNSTSIKKGLLGGLCGAAAIIILVIVIFWVVRHCRQTPAIFWKNGGITNRLWTVQLSRNEESSAILTADEGVLPPPDPNHARLLLINEPSDVYHTTTAALT